MIRIGACAGMPALLEEIGSAAECWERRRFLELEFIFCCDPQELLAEQELKGHLDLVFMDMQPEGCMDGIDAALSIKSFDDTTDIVFISPGRMADVRIVTAHPAGCLVRPLKIPEIQFFLDHTVNCRDLGRFIFRSGHRFISVSTEDIIYLYHLDRKLYIFCTGNRDYETYMRMDDAELKLSDGDISFIRIHNSYLVNPRFVEAVDSRHIWLKDGRDLPLGRPYNRRVMSYYEGLLQKVTTK
ncbi:MAG: response regulator transcription factor [Lachnospiraceae bacterium]|nr:response regulator transcription factor [Lachnospiraceae bacterium]